MPPIDLTTMTMTAVPEADLRAALATRIEPSRFGLWFGEGIRLGVEGEELRVRVPNAFFQERIRTHFAANLIEAAEALAGRPLRLTFAVGADCEADPPLGDTVRRSEPDVGVGGGGRPGVTIPLPGSEPSAPSGPSVPQPPSLRPQPPASGLAAEPARSNYPSGTRRGGKRLEDFVVGAGSKLAHAAAVEMARSGGRAFNPLVIHGGIGLGKTHLLEGIAAALRAARPGLNVVHLTAEAFTNGFLDALRVGGLTAFRAKYRNAGALILDDVHFLAAKKSTQDEFLHTFNALVAAGAPVVLSTDQHPRLIAKLTDELATRFLGGMIVKLEPPDLATRRAIVQARATSRGVSLPEAVVSYIAEHLRGSVRELEGALNSLIAHATLTGRKLDLNLARTALRDTIRHTAQAVALKDVVRAVCELCGVEPDAVRSDGRARAVSQPRMIAMFLARKHTGVAYSEIGRYFGGRNHSTVIAAEKKVQGWLQDEARCGRLAGFETISDLIAAAERAIGA